MESLKRFLVVLTLVCFSSATLAQDVPHLASPLLEGQAAPFSGILISESDFILSLENDVTVSHLREELGLRTTQMAIERRLYEEFTSEQRTRIDALSTESWWDKNGNWFMFGSGLLLGVIASALIVGFASK